MSGRFDSSGEIQDAFYLTFRKRNWLLGWPQLVASTVSWLLVFLIPAGTQGIPAAWHFVAAAYFDPNSLAHKGPFTGHLLNIVIGYALNSIAIGWMLVAAQSLLAGKKADYTLGFREVMAKWLPLSVIGVFASIPSLIDLYSHHSMEFVASQNVNFVSLAGIFLLFAIIGFSLAYVNAFIVLGNQSLVAALSGSTILAWKNITSTITLLLANGVVFVLLLIPSLLLWWLAPAAHFVETLSISVSLLPAGAFYALTTTRFYSGLLPDSRCTSPRIAPVS